MVRQTGELLDMLVIFPLLLLGQRDNVLPLQIDSTQHAMTALTWVFMYKYRAFLAFGAAHLVTLVSGNGNEGVVTAIHLGTSAPSVQAR